MNILIQIPLIVPHHNIQILPIILIRHIRTHHLHNKVRVPNHGNNLYLSILVFLVLEYLLHGYYLGGFLDDTLVHFAEGALADELEEVDVVGEDLRWGGLAVA